MTIKGFENEDIETSGFGEWVGKDYIDYKFEYKNQEKIIKELFKRKQELIEYLKKEIEDLENIPKDEEMTLEAYGRLNAYRIILLKIEKR